MPENDTLNRRLRNLGALGDSELRTESVRSRVRQAIEAEIDADRSGRGRSPLRRTRLWRYRGVLVSAVCVLVAVAVVAGALVFVSGRSGGRDRPSTTPGAAGLIARLGVLRRPQTSADRLPAHHHLVGSLGTIIPGLTRRIGVRSGSTIYLAVSTPAPMVTSTYTYPSVPWPARFGDQVSLVAVRGSNVMQTAPVPAVDLDNATVFAPIAPTAAGGSGGRGVQVAQIVPDGVARVRWRYPAPPHRFIPVRFSAVTDNVALAPPRRTAPVAARWLTATGTTVHTSTAVAHRVAAEEQRQQARLVISRLRRAHAVVPSPLLRGFAVFHVGGPPAFTRDGVTVTRPKLSALPLTIAEDIDLKVVGAKLAPDQTREVTTRSGARFWVTPGANGICLFVPLHNVLRIQPQGSLGGGFGTSTVCSVSVRAALMDGLGVTTAYAASGDIAAGILPRTRATTTLRATRGSRRTIRPSLGVYDIRIPRP